MIIKTFFPILQWLTSYKKEWLKGDITAGITVGIMLIPQGIAYAMIAGLPPIYGLYTAMIPQLVYAIFGTSRQLSVGPVAMDSLIVASGVAALAEVGTDHFIELAVLLATMMGIFQLVFGLFKLGFLVNFLSKPVISGFTSAAALIIGFNQLKNLSGIPLERNNKIQVLITNTLEHLGQIQWITLGIGLFSVIILVLFKKYFRKIPAALIVVIVGILLVRIFHLEQYNVAIVGDIPKGLPSFKIPVFTKEILIQLGPMALTLAFIGFLEAISVAKAIEVKHTEYKLKPNQELIAIGMGNIIGSFFQTYPATGGFSRTAVNDQANANTPLASIIASLIVGLTLLFLTPVFYYLPKAVLAAIIIVAVFGLIDFVVPKELLKYEKRDLLILNITLLVTAGIGIKEGIIIGVLLSLAMLIYKSTRPHIALLGNVPTTHFYRNIKRFSNLIIDKNILIIRFDAQLHFANSSFFKDQLSVFAQQKGTDLQLIIIDSESLNNIDSSAVYALYEVVDYFQNKNIEIVFTGVKGPVRDRLEFSGFTSKIGENHFFMNIQEAVDCFHQSCLSNSGKEIRYQSFVSQFKAKKKKEKKD